MKRAYVIGLTGSVALVGMVLCAGLAGAEPYDSAPAAAQTRAPEAAQTPAPEAAPARAATGEATDEKRAERMKACPCPMCPMAAKEGEMGKGRDMDKGTDRSPAMRQRQMMSNTEMSKDDAACLLASKSELTLTPEQVQKLEQIIKQSRTEAVAVLTSEQKEKLEDIPKKPTSMHQMGTSMHERMSRNIGTSVPEDDGRERYEEPGGAASPRN